MKSVLLLFGKDYCVNCVFLKIFPLSCLCPDFKLFVRTGMSAPAPEAEPRLLARQDQLHKQ
jgi:hypothetical protein